MSAKSVHLACETYFEDTLVKLPCLLTLETLLRNNTSHCTEKPRHCWLHLGKSPRSKEDLAQPKICIHKHSCILLNPLFGHPVDQCLNLDVTDSLGERMLCLRGRAVHRSHIPWLALEASISQGVTLPHSPRGLESLLVEDCCVRAAVPAPLSTSPLHCTSGYPSLLGPLPCCALRLPPPSLSHLL